MNTINYQFQLASRPQGSVKASDFNYVAEQLHDLQEDEILIKNLYISLDPAMRGWMNESKNSYMPPVAIGEVMRALAVGQVVASKNARFAAGEHVSGLLGMQEYAYSDGKGISKVDARLAPLPLYLSTLGMPGMTAYFGLLEVGQPREGNTVVVSGAAGAVGTIVGQIAKIKGAGAVGIAGGADKCRYLIEQLGFDAAIDYKTEDVSTALRQHCPDGIDVYFDNVGGDILDAALAQLAFGARVVICGAISQYNNTTPIKGPSNYLNLMVKRATMKGVMVSDYYPRAMEAARDMGGWISSGKLKSREDIVEGLEKFPEAFQKLFTGENNGKLILKVMQS
ncbi:NADP-dependent oxidoreductase [Undibacterium sp. CY18W]|uniref:NADP-dependent oxidoreductase n=1 Tax=Undibacterium hunanense TaxID=2762292 RepID=A0ABR6ZS69_9BURK|nr:NADP-dependent oxidoreductase [Undibacterium hunanense]MBC3918726.1 NADP-dependent oxidoreductase [Undibacterium hunanense]